MQVIDGKLYPPMSARVEGKLREPEELGTWGEAEERPDLVRNGKFTLRKGKGADGKDLGSVPAAYNPYFHASRSPLNDQFKSAWDRPNLVTVECEIPESELTSGYKAEGAKDSVGETAWPAGAVGKELAKLGRPRKVVLSRWLKPVRILDDKEVAAMVADQLKGTDIVVPENTVTPSLKAALEEAGVKIGAPEKGMERAGSKGGLQSLVAHMENIAEPQPILELTRENWEKEFGKDGKLQTPLGIVKMGKHQYVKLEERGRAGEFGMIRPTLSNPDVVIEKYAPAEGAERDTKYLFVKTFRKADGSRYVHYESVTVLKDGMEVSVSSHEADGSAIKKEMQNGKILHLRKELSVGSEWYLTNAPAREGPDLVPTSDNAKVNNSPDTAKFDGGNIRFRKLSGRGRTDFLGRVFGKLPKDIASRVAMANVKNGGDLNKAVLEALKDGKGSEEMWEDIRDLLNEQREKEGIKERLDTTEAKLTVHDMADPSDTPLANMERSAIRFRATEASDKEKREERKDLRRLYRKSRIVLPLAGVKKPRRSGAIGLSSFGRWLPYCGIDVRNLAARAAGGRAISKSLVYAK